MLNEFVAYGAGGAASAGAGIMGILPVVLIWGAFMYFVMIRPQKKKQKAHKELLDSLKEGDEVFTSGGMKGEVVSANDEFVVIRVDKGTKITFKRAAITSIYKKK